MWPVASTKRLLDTGTDDARDDHESKRHKNSDDTVPMAQEPSSSVNEKVNNSKKQKTSITMSIGKTRWRYYKELRGMVVVGCRCTVAKCCTTRNVPVDVSVIGEVLMCYVNPPPWTMPLGSCPSDINTFTKKKIHLALLGRTDPSRCTQSELVMFELPRHPATALTRRASCEGGATATSSTRVRSLLP